jgi:hypothetical protein
LLEGRCNEERYIIRRIGTCETTHDVEPKVDSQRIICSILLSAKTMIHLKKLLVPLRRSSCPMPMDVDSICKITLNTRTQEDTWSWHYKKSGILSVWSVYGMHVGWFEQRPTSSGAAMEDKTMEDTCPIEAPSLFMEASSSVTTYRGRAAPIHMAHSSRCLVCRGGDSWRYSLYE